jgi:hypothetical protein
MLLVQPYEGPSLLANTQDDLGRLTEAAATKIRYMPWSAIAYLEFLLSQVSDVLSNQQGAFLAIPLTYCQPYDAVMFKSQNLIIKCIPKIQR